MEKLVVGLGDRAYPIHIGEGLLDRAGELIRTVYSGGRAALLSDDVVWPLYGERVTAALKAEGIEPFAIILPHGEGSKTLHNLEKVLEEMAEQGLRRSGLLVALGGGVIGDLGGFAASSYMRGIAHVQIPTTLLSQVDSSVGGKTAVNLRHGKNLAGAFWQPGLVIIDTATLETLPPREFAGGMAEVIKYGVIRDRDLFDHLVDHRGREAVKPVMPEIIRRCCAIKAGVVARDERDTGERMLLNMGHTFGHAIEKLGNYTRFIHGEAVALGTVMAARYGEEAGLTPRGTAEEICDLFSGFDLPVETKIAPDALVPYIGLDKKAGEGTLRLILIREIGDAFIHETGPEEFARLMDTL